MITFSKIRYKNFLSSGNNLTEIELNTHKNTLIMGHNGAGKSTILDALTFSLFGKPFRKVNKGNVVNSINNKACVVEIEFEIANKTYKVIRGAKPNVFEIWCNGIMLNQDAAVRDYQEHLEKNILRMNYKTFTQVVILGSASFVPFMQLSSSDRRQVIENLLDIQIFSAMSTVVKNRMQSNKDALDRARITLSSKEENKAYIERMLKTLRSNSENKLAELVDRANELRNEQTLLQSTLDEKQNAVDKLLKNVVTEGTLRKKHTTLVSMRSKMENNKNRIYKESEFYHDNDTCPTCKQSIEPDFKAAKIGHNHTKLLEIDDGLNKIGNQIDACLSEIAEIESVLRKINELQMDLSSTKSSYNHTADSLRQIVAQIEGFDVADKTTQESERQLSEIEHGISQLQAEKETLLDERQYIDMATTLLKDGGIKTKIIKQYLPVINKYINKYLNQMGFFVNFNIDENFNETIKSRYRDEFSYNNFSEGEKLRIDLAILLTWRQIAKLKNSVNVNIIVFDEILDRAMDASGIDEFIRLMWEMGDQGTNAFVISHKDGVQDRFQRTLRFEKVKNFSVMSKDE